MQKNHIFAEEVDKIVVAPYSVLFKRLHQILKHTSVRDLHIWSITKTCQIRPFVTRILQSLSIDEHARPVLYSVVRSQKIRDDVLLHRPSVLNEVFFLPADKHDDCVSLFNTPFPKTITIPQNAISFIEQVLSNGHDVSPQIWVRQSQMILRSCGIGILEIIDDAAVETCFNLWSSILKTNQNFEFLCCLDIACMLQHYTAEIDAGNNSSVPTYTECGAIRNWTAKACGLLKMKSDKLIRSLLLRALYFVSDKPDATNDRAVEAAIMIKSILGGIDHLMIHNIMQEKENLEALTKLTHKVNRLEIKPVLQLIMFDIIRSLSPDFHLLQTFTYASLQNVLSVVPSPDSGIQKSSYVDSLRSALTTQLDAEHPSSDLSAEELGHKNCFKTCLQYAIDQCMPGRQASVDSILRLEQASLLVEAMSQATRSCHAATLAQQVLSLKMPEWWNMEFVTPQSPQNCAFLGTCPHILEARRQHVTLGITNLIMQISCLHGVPLSQHNYELLNYRISRAITQNDSYICTFVTLCDYKFSTHTSINQPAEHISNLDQELAILHAKTSEMVQHHVNMICKDLQERCDNVEEPLRAARFGAQRLKEDLESLRQEADSAAVKHEDECANLQLKIHELEHDIEAVQQVNESTKKQQTMNEVRWQAEMDSLHNTNAVLVEQIANLERKEAELNSLLKDKDEAIQQIRNEVDACTSTRDILHLELSEARDKEKRLLSVLFENKAVCVT